MSLVNLSTFSNNHCNANATQRLSSELETLKISLESLQKTLKRLNNHIGTLDTELQKLHPQKNQHKTPLSMKKTLMMAILLSTIGATYYKANGNLPLGTSGLMVTPLGLEPNQPYYPIALHPERFTNPAKFGVRTIRSRKEPSYFQRLKNNEEENYPACYPGGFYTEPLTRNRFWEKPGSCTPNREWDAKSKKYELIKKNKWDTITKRFLPINHGKKKSGSQPRR